MSHTRAVLSSDAVRTAPVWSHTVTALTRPLWPSSTRKHLPLLRSHTLRTRSAANQFNCCGRHQRKSLLARLFRLHHIAANVFHVLRWVTVWLGHIAMMNVSIILNHPVRTVMGWIGTRF
jgi:hypothetical protein